MIHDDREGTSPDSGLVSFFAVVKERPWLIVPSAHNDD